MDSDEENGPKAHSTPKRDESTPVDKQPGTPLDSNFSGHLRQGLEQTGDSTRSLLSVLSHSSVENVSEGSYSSTSEGSSSSSKLTSRKRRSKSPPSSGHKSKSITPSSQSSSRIRSASVTSQSNSRHRSRPSASSQSKQSSRSASSAASQSSSRTPPIRLALTPSSSAKTRTASPSSEPQLSPWEKWLVQKTEEERKQVRLQVKRERDEKRKKEEAERVKKEKDSVIKARVEEWIEEKTKSGKERVKRSERIEQRKKDKKEKEQQELLKRAKSNRRQWLGDKTKQAEEQKLREEEAKAKSAEEGQERRTKAYEAYQRWYQEAKRKPRTVPSSWGVTQGMLKGYYDTAAYPIPNFYNPIPWMPIHVPKATEEQHSSGRKGQQPRSKKGPGGKKRGVVLQPASPPLLFKDRQTAEKCNRWGRPR